MVSMEVRDTLATSPGAPTPKTVTHALTVQGPQQALAMVIGKKQIENRGWRIPRGWYALHVGSQPLSAIGMEWVDRMETAWPDAPPENTLPRSSLVGLIHVTEQLTVPEAKERWEGDVQSVWAAGPVCHIIEHAISFKRPIRHRGDRGLWRISEEAMRAMTAEVERSCSGS